MNLIKYFLHGIVPVAILMGIAWLITTYPPILIPIVVVGTAILFGYAISELKGG